MRHGPVLSDFAKQVREQVANAYPGTATAKAVAAALGCTNLDASKKLTDAKVSGWCVTVAHGEYRATDKLLRKLGREPATEEETAGPRSTGDALTDAFLARGFTVYELATVVAAGADGLAPSADLAAGA